jgi:ribonuclease P/MRP protein subunit POP5
MKHLPKHLRAHWRYLGVALRSDPDLSLDRGSFQREVWYALQNLLGDPGAAAVDGTVVRFRFDAPSGGAVVRVRRGEVDRGRAALACVDAVDGHPLRVVVRGTSGTIRACEEKYLPGPQELREQSDVAFEGAQRPAVCDGTAVDVRTDEGVVGATRRDLE